MNHLSTSSAKSGSFGITLIELLVVVAIASVSLSVVIPSVGAGMTGLKLRSAARKVAVAIAAGREQAIYQQRQFRFEVDEVKNVIALDGTRDAPRREFSLPDDVSIRVRNMRSPDISNESESSGQVWKFDIEPDGAMSAANIVLSVGTRSIRIMVDPLTASAIVKEK